MLMYKVWATLWFLCIRERATHGLLTAHYYHLLDYTDKKEGREDDKKEGKKRRDQGER